MADPQLLRTTLEAVDEFVDLLRHGRSDGVAARTSDPRPRLVIDEGRAAAEWALAIDVRGVVEHIGLLVVCEVAGDRLTDARLYVSAARPVGSRQPSTNPTAHEVST